MKESTRNNLIAYRDATLEVVAESLWPTRCAVCDAPGEHLCEACARALPYIDTWRACPRCGAPYGSIQCTECNPIILEAFKRDKPPFDYMASAVVLTDETRRMVIAYKDGGDRAMAAVLAEITARYVPPPWRNTPLALPSPQAPAVVTYIPATSSARRRRGFDHAALLAERTAENIGAECASLFRLPRSRDQRKLGRAGRLSNMKSSLTLAPGASCPERVIVVDDVCTTGATLFAAADALRQAGSQEILGLTFARAW